MANGRNYYYSVLELQIIKKQIAIFNPQTPEEELAKLKIIKKVKDY